MTRKKQIFASIITRTAIDNSGRLGSLYNGWNDRMVGISNLTCENPLEEFPLRSQCTLVKIDPTRHPLQLIDIDEQSRLSLLLNLTPKEGLATIFDHSQSMNVYTRLLRYTYLYRQEHFPSEIPAITSETKATHIVTGISWGIDIITVLQLPSDETVAATIDLTLEKYRSYLNGERDEFKLTREDINSLAKILETQTYSNIVELDRTTPLHNLFHDISRFKLDAAHHQPLTYTLCSLHALYRPLPVAHTSTLEQHLVTLSSSMKILEICFNENMPNLLGGHFKERLLTVSNQWAIIKQEYPRVVAQYAQLVENIRSGRLRPSALPKRLRSKVQLNLKNRIDHLTRDVTNLNAKGHLISELDHQQIQYRNASELPLTKQDDETSLKQKLIVDETTDRVLCSTDLLNRNKPALFRQLRRALLDELADNSKLHLTYVDFSYCDYPLPRMMVLPPPQERKRQAPLKPPRVETLNILLLGETGVGKSTFISALINYLTFQTLDKARSCKPIVDQPVVEHCQSYVYHLNHKLKLRIIDTPAFGDTRDSEQDERTTQHIFQYSKKFEKLNAVCCLLESNAILPSCIAELVNLLGPTIRDNLLFCFTNSRSTPDPIKKKNTFCFDGEAFHALQNQPSFNDSDYEASWKTSVAESKRLIRYIRKKLRPCPIPDESKAIKNLRIKIVHLTHPMVEAMRYILRNIVINKMISLKQPIELSADHDQRNYEHLPHRPIIAEFLQDYRIAKGPLSGKQDDMIDHLSLICHIGAEFSDFLMHTARYRNGDPFLTGLHRLIGEESEICENHNRNYMNLQLVEGLKKLTSHYEQHIQTIKSNSRPIARAEIEQWIQYMSDYPLVSGYVIDSARTNIEINH